MGYGINDLIKGMSGNIDKIAEAANKKKAQEEADEMKKLREPPKKITLVDAPVKKPAPGFNNAATKKPPVQGQETLDRIQKIQAEIEEAQRAKPSYKTPAR
jgi:hypothetical protein